MRDQLTRLGIEVSSTQESVTIGEYSSHLTSPKGRGIGGFFSGGKIKIETYHDHRIAMTFGVLESYLSENYNEKMKIVNPDCVAKTYPNFWEDLKKLGEIEDRLKV